MAGFVKYYEVLLQKAAVDIRSATILYNDFQNGNLIYLSDFTVEGRYSVIHDDLFDAEKYFEEINQLYQQARELISTN